MSTKTTITVDNVEYVRKDTIQENAINTDGLKYVIVRCKNAGVHAGFLKERNEHTLTLVDSRRLWRWWSKFTLSGLATCGVLESKKDDVRFACVLPEIQLTTLCGEVCEVIPCTEKSMKSIMAIKDYENE